jgi:hypothetical protein
VDPDAQAQALQVFDLRRGGTPDLPMPVLKHQMSHVRRRPFARDGHHSDRDPDQRPPTSAPDLEQS